MKSIFALPVVAAALLEGEQDYTHYTYADWLAEFGSAENGYSAEREAIFNSNMEQVNAHNANPDKEWWASPNRWADRTNEEFQSLIKGRKTDFFKGEHQVFERNPNAEVPDRVDWRETDGVVTPVKDQGGCGSCWAFSAAETLESHLAIATGEAAPKLSPQQLVSCSPNPDHCGGTGGCQGSTQPLAFAYTQTAGITTEASYPYRGTTGTCDTSKINVVAKNSGYTQLPMNDYSALVEAVATQGPIAISLAAGGFMFQFYGGGVLSNCNDYVMDHAVQLVGYGTDNGKDYWLVRNSWGNWGESGYMRIRRYGEGSEPCGTDSRPQDGDACEGDTAPRTYCGECGILSSSSYPTGMTKSFLDEVV
jgi:cathepsin L